MSLFNVKRGQGSNAFRIKIADSTSTSNAGLTGLTYSSSGLIISTICDNEATATAYTSAGSTIETITTLGTFSAPTTNKCRFKEVDATNHKGLYEIQLADARFSVSSAKRMVISISGVTNMVQTDFIVMLVDVDPYDTTQIPDAILDRNMATGTDSGGRTVRNALRILRNKVDTSTPGTMSVKKEDDSTEAWSATLTTNSSASPVTIIDPA